MSGEESTRSGDALTGRLVAAGLKFEVLEESLTG